MAEEHFAALRPRRSNIITPENSLSLIVIVQATLVVLTDEREGEFSGVMILLRLSARTEAGEVHINSSKLRKIILEYRKTVVFSFKKRQLG